MQDPPLEHLTTAERVAKRIVVDVNLKTEAEFLKYAKNQWRLCVREIFDFLPVAEVVGLQNQLSCFHLNPDFTQVDDNEKEEILHEMKKEEEAKTKEQREEE